MRVTQGMLSQTTLNNIEANISRLNTIEAQVTSGTRLTKPSDDPIGTAQALNFQEGIDQTNQFLTNINAASSWLSTSDSALSTVDNSLQRARELAVQAANGTLTSSDRQSIQAEISQIQQSVLQSSQAKYGASYIFSGTRSDAPGYVSANPSSVAGAYQGNSAAVLRQVAPGQNIAVNTDATATFDPVFTALSNLNTALSSNNTAGVQSSITDIDTALTAVLKARSTAGALSNRMTALQNQMSAVQTNMTGLLSQVKDVDMAKAITDFQMSQNVYNASLQAGAKAMQPSLLDYLK
jgi:flagellar hook-associated protein 3 FlgL